MTSSITFEFTNQGHMSLNEFMSWVKLEFSAVRFERPSTYEITFETPDASCSGYFHKDYADGEITGSPTHIKSFKKFLESNRQKFKDEQVADNLTDLLKQLNVRKMSKGSRR